MNEGKQDFADDVIHKYKQELIKRIQEIPNPYPTDVFAVLTTDQWKKIHKVLQEELGLRLDQVSGNLYSRGFEVARKDIIAEVEGWR